MANAQQLREIINGLESDLGDLNPGSDAAQYQKVSAQLANARNQLEQLSSGQSTPISQMAQPAPQPSSPRDITPPPPVQPTTPVSQVAPQSTSSGYQFPTLNQSIIDAQLNKLKTNELTSFNSDIRDQIYNAGWNQKSDAVQVLKGAAVYGLAKPINAGIMGSPMYQKPNGQAITDADFVNAAKSAGIDPNLYYHKQAMGMGGMQNVLDRNALYKAIDDKSKDLYSITNALSGAKRGDAAPHATVLYQADQNGNLVPKINEQTGQPDAKYFSATRYANPESFMDTFGPFLALAPAVGGILGASGLFGPGVIGADIGSAAGDLTAGLDYGQVAADAAGTAGAAGIGGYSDIVPASELGAQGEAFGTNINAIGEAGATAPAIGPLTLKEQAMQALGIGGNNQSALGNLLNPSGSSDTAINTALANAGLSSLIGSGGQALGSYLSGQAQADAAKQASANQMSMFNTINQQFAPNRAAGYSALNQIRSMLPGQYTTYGETGQPTGTAQGTDYLTHQFGPQDLYAGLAPNYNFMLQQGQQANQRAANVGGGLIGGNALRGLEDYTQNYAQNAYQNAFGNYQNQRTGIYNTLANIAGIGQNATNTSAQAGQNAVTAQGQLGVGAAAANAAGLTGAANAVQGGLQNYQQNQLLQAILGQNQNVAQKPA